MNRKLRIALGGLVLALVTVVGCDDLLQDSTFRLWCGNDLCAWKTEAGSIRRAPTWHKADFGVELVDAPTAISQEVDRSGAACLVFTTIADVAVSAQVTIGLDFNRDGTIDYEQPIAATGFREVKTAVTPPKAFDGIRFVITKKGAGRAVLAEIRVRDDAAGCSGAPPLPLKAQPLGTPCDEASGDTCASGVCCDGVCSECCVPSSTPDDDAGLGAPIDPITTAECVVGECALRTPMLKAARQCDPGKHTHPANAECLADDDCESGTCDGASSRALNRKDFSACPGTFPDPGPDCFITFAHGGRCK